MSTTKQQVHSSRIELAEIGRNHWHVKAEYGHTLADAMDPGYCWNSWSRIKAGDFIDIAPDNFRWLLRLYVVKVDEDSQGILTRVLEKHDWTDAAAPKVDVVDVTVDWGGPVHKWRVRRGEKVLKPGFAERDEAQKWADALASGDTGGEQKAA